MGRMQNGFGLVPLLYSVFYHGGWGSGLRGEVASSPEPAPQLSEAGCIMSGMATLTQPPLIPRTLLFGNPEKTQARLSPDGNYLSFLAPLDGVLNVFVGPVDKPAAARPVTFDKKRGVRQHVWAYTSTDVLYLQDEAGDENWHLYRVKVSSGETLDLTPLAGVQARVQHLSPEFPQHVLALLNDRDPAAHDLYRIDIDTGARERVLQNDEGFLELVSDEALRVRFGVRMTADGGSDIFRRTEVDTWASYASVVLEDQLTTTPVGIAGNTLYMLDSRGRDTGALFDIDLANGDRRVLLSDERVDVSDILTHPRTRRAQAAAVDFEKKRWVALDPDIEADLAYLETVAAGVFDVVDRSLADDKWIVAYRPDDGPMSYYLYERPAQKAHFLFNNKPALESVPLAKMHPVVIDSRDGLELVSYLTLPLNSTPDGTPDSNRDGNRGGQPRPEQPLPLVLLVHGGPWGRDGWGFDPTHQWLADRGYAVLSVNFRGSTGFGKAFVNAGNLAWGREMHDDLLDAVAWAVSTEVAQKDKVAVMGGSYGGYATLAALAFTPEVFAAGVDIVGPSNLVTLLDSIPPYWTPMLAMLTARVGDPRTEAGRELLKERSPVNYADRIAKPLLIGQGANDPRVKRAESDGIVSALESNDIPVTYVLYPDEGHGFARPENNLSFNAVVEAFLSEHLGGRFEPVGADFEDSSLEVLSGLDGVPGLAEAVKAKA